MQTLNFTAPGGARCTYKLSPNRDVGTLQEKLAKCTGKAKKPAIKADSRGYPVFKAGISTADYVAAYAGMNNWSTHYVRGFFGPLNPDPCELYSGADVHETIGDDAPMLADAAPVAQDAPQALESAAVVPMAQDAAPRASSVDSEASAAVADAIGAALIARFGVSDPAACEHLPAFPAEYARIVAECAPTAPAAKARTPSYAISAPADAPVAPATQSEPPARVEFKALRLGDAFQFDTDGPVWVRSRGGFRSGRGGPLHACATHVPVIVAPAVAKPAPHASSARGIVADYSTAHAASWDAGNRSARAAGRSVWDSADFDAAAETFARILPPPVAPPAPPLPAWPAMVASAHHAATGATRHPHLRIPAGDPRVRIPARFAPSYLLQAARA